MTTAVQVLMPKPNHRRVRVDVVQVNTDGSEAEVLNSHELDHGQVSETLYVHNLAILKISEID